MRILLAMLFGMLGGVAQAATIVDERQYGGTLPDDVFEESCHATCYTSWFSDTRNVFGVPMIFDVPVGMRLASAKIDYKLTFSGVGDFDNMRFFSFGYIEAPLQSFYPDVFPELTSDTRTQVFSDSIRLRVNKATRADWERFLFTSFDIGGAVVAAGRMVSDDAMRVGLDYRLTYKTVPLAPVPLPASGLVMLAALGGLVLASRRRAANGASY